MIKENILKAFENFNSHTDDYLGALYINIFKSFPSAYRIFYNADEKLTYLDAVESFQEARKNIKKKIDSRKLLQNLLKDHKKYNPEVHYGQKKPDHFLYGSKIFAYSPHEYLILGDYCKNGDNHHYNFLMNITLAEDGNMANYYEEIFCEAEDIQYIFENLKGYFVSSIKEEKVEFGIASIDGVNNIFTTWYDYQPIKIDITQNYNDDFVPVYKKLCSIVEEEDKPGLVLLYGEPGTGKSTILKSLISKYPDKDFVFIDDQLLVHASPEKLLTYFLNSQNTIFILEDCEKALKSRENSYNPVMPTLLNLTDGIIADVLGIKIICTFNTSLSQIDKALLRKGRLSLKYEFKKLSSEKASKLLGTTQTTDISLAEIYHYKEENDYSKKETRKIGF